MPSSALERIPDRSRLTRAEVGALLNLHKAGKTQVEIAQALGIDQSNVSRWLDKLVDTTELAKHTLRNSASTLAKRVVKNANVEESLEVLDRLEVLPKRQTEARAGGVNIVIGMPGQPAGPDPVVVDLSPSVAPVLHRLTTE